MSELYLIAHKVRGEPAFDVAQRIQIGEELAWIIPTSGWRAYPYWHVNLDYLMDSGSWPGSMPEGLRDHFASEHSGGKITTLSLADLGL